MDGTYRDSVYLTGPDGTEVAYTGTFTVTPKTPEPPSLWRRFLAWLRNLL